MSWSLNPERYRPSIEGGVLSLRAISAAFVLALSISCGGQQGVEAEASFAPERSVRTEELVQSGEPLPDNQWYRICWSSAGLYYTTMTFRSYPPIPLDLWLFKTLERGDWVYQFHQIWFSGEGDARPNAAYANVCDAYGSCGYVRAAALCRG
jgi:hypothetical protein